MYLTGFKLLLDFGLVVLIWIVQRIVYPSFLYYNNKDLIVWHKKYTSRFSFIVIPLMLGQLGISLYQINTVINSYTIVNLILIILVWLSTFLQFVPIHMRISNGIINDNTLNILVKNNWIRTVLWTLIFLFNILHLIITDAKIILR